MKEQKKTIPLALALCVAAAVVNYSSLLGIITGLPRSFSGGVLGIIGYLANAVITFAPLALAVLLWQHRTKNQRKPVRIVCIAAGAAYLVRILLIVVNMARYGGFTLDSVLTNLFTLLPMVICMYMCLWAGSCIKKWMVKRGLGYFLVLGGGTFILLLNMVVPMFMSVSVPVRTALLTYFPALIMLYLPDTIIAPDKAKPVTQTSAVVLVIAAFVILFILPSTRGLELHSNDSSSSYAAEAVECPSCHKKYTDSSNKNRIRRSGSCNDCNDVLDAISDALGRAG
ncbi:MAG: hypothetical protein HFF72_01380 [Oscillospiraceae bacterium]|jgi:hypothetical protein|nr:hypothetical protein [Oscillospiraceae bacterium]